jgi:stress response protein YsnF
LVISRTFTIPDNYQDRINQGGALVTVMTVENNTRTAEAEGFLTRHNGEIEHDFERFEPVDTSAKDFVDRGQCIQLLSEVLRVHKERVQRGEVCLRKDVVTETQNVQLPVSREEIVVDRVPVEGQAATDRRRKGNPDTSRRRTRQGGKDSDRAGKGQSRQT